MFFFSLPVLQLERQLSAAGESNMVGMRNDHSSESEMSDIDDEESQVDIVSTPSQPNAKKIKTSYNAKVMYQWNSSQWNTHTQTHRNLQISTAVSQFDSAHFKNIVIRRI